jgi:hypothetical protein
MADVKISQLPAATTPVDGTEVLPIVQSATTKQVSIANLTAGRAMSASSLTLTNPLAVTSGGTGIATAAEGALLSATAANTFSATRTPTLGLAGTAAGTLGLSGSTSGVVTLATAAAAGTWTFTLPTSGGSNGWILTTNGSGVSTWTNPTALGVDLDVGTTAITGGTTGRVLYNNAGVLGEYAITGTGSVVLGTSPTFTTSAIFPAGTVGAPGITTTGDTNTGIYFPAADTIGFVEGGVEAMRLDASGNLLVGQSTSRGTRATFYGVNGAAGSDNGVVDINTTNALAVDLGGSVSFGGVSTSGGSITRYAMIAGRKENATSGSFTGYLQFATTGSDGITGERMRLDASGNLGIGSTTPTGARLYINGGSLFTGSPGSYGVGISGSLTSGRIGTYGTTTASVINSYFDDSTIEISAGVTSGFVTGISITARSGSAYGDTIRFVTRGTGTNEAARIDSSGNLLVGKTATASTTIGWLLSAVDSNAKFDTGRYLVLNRDTDDILINFRRSNTSVGTITVTTTTTAYNTSSDRNLKENIAPASSALASILALPIRQFDWKSDGSHTDYGMVAQEAYDFVPEIVTQGELWSVDYGRITPRFIKAFQELAAKVTALEEQLNG